MKRGMIHFPSGYYIAILLGFFSIGSSGQDLPEARITTWFRGKAGAVSFSFDDGGYTQYSAAYPILEKNGIKATFSIVGEWVREEPSRSGEADQFEFLKMGWQQLSELSEHGHELAAHGFLHRRYDKFGPIDSLAGEMARIRSLTEARIHRPVLTIHYPYSYASGNIPEAARRADYLFGRTGLDTVNPATPQNLHLLASRAILNDHNPDTSLLRKWLKQARDGWLILMYHNLFSDDSKEMTLIRAHHVNYSYSLPPELFEEQVREVMAMDYWVAPIGTIGKYIIERNAAKIRTIRCKNQIIIVVTQDLDTKIYNQPLTLEATVPWKFLSVSGSLQDGIYQVTNQKIQLDVQPESVIILSKKK